MYLKHSVPLDPGFEPAALAARQFLKSVEDSGNAQDIAICVERHDGLRYTFKTKVSGDSEGRVDESFKYIERLTKSILWTVGGYKIIVGGSKAIYEKIRQAYSKGGIREFDRDFMSGVYEREFEVEHCEFDKIPETVQKSISAGGNLDGCRIGFDAGGSDRKVSAVIDGNVVFSEEVVWHPKVTVDPQYHYDEIVRALNTAAGHMPRVDAIGVSSAGIYINNRTMIASLFLKVPKEDFDKKVKDIYINAAKTFGDVPLEVANDGDVTALAGAIDLEDNGVLGIAMGTSEAAGYVDTQGNILGWLNELAFVPIDFNENAMVDEWSGDYGCGVKYFSQDGVIKLAPEVGVAFKENSTPAEKLKLVQDMHVQSPEKIDPIFESIGRYLGYSLAWYAMFYDIKHVLILGRVTSGRGGTLILENARKVLVDEFPELADINLQMPDESNRRVGQSIAAASLPVIPKK